jgi:hypothetical protein
MPYAFPKTRFGLNRYASSLACLISLGTSGCHSHDNLEHFAERNDHLGHFSERIECEKLLDSGLSHFEQEWPIGPGKEYETAQAQYGFYSPSENRCVIKIVSISPEPHKSAVWFYGTLEHSVIESFSDHDLGTTRREMFEKADQAEMDLRK